MPWVEGRLLYDVVMVLLPLTMTASKNYLFDYVCYFSAADFLI